MAERFRIEIINNHLPGNVDATPNYFS